MLARAHTRTSPQPLPLSSLTTPTPDLISDHGNPTSFAYRGCAVLAGAVLVVVFLAVLIRGCAVLARAVLVVVFLAVLIGAVQCWRGCACVPTTVFLGFPSPHQAIPMRQRWPRLLQARGASIHTAHHSTAFTQRGEPSTRHSTTQHRLPHSTAISIQPEDPQHPAQHSTTQHRLPTLQHTTAQPPYSKRSPNTSP
ncbi:hypothetical protein O3P69_015237 [Scylla paramamosain]|uniref:Uncharacterized protein n=1 Tax=Scylla paramamosain TaxID=85552 RepID=A0AAW0T592_SCYPA